MSENRPNDGTPNPKAPSELTEQATLLHRAQQLLADIKARQETQENATTPTAWAYEQDGSMNPPIVTTSRWSRTPQDWNETNLSRTLADPNNGPTSDNLHNWSTSLNRAAAQTTNQALSIELHTVAQELDNAAVFAQAQTLLQAHAPTPEPQQTHLLYDNLALLSQAKDFYVLMDNRQTVGNQVLFHAKNRQGYTTNLAEAHLFTAEEAKRLNEARTTDIAYKIDYLLEAATIGVDSDALARLNGTTDRGVDSVHRMLEMQPSAKKPVRRANPIIENALFEELNRSESKQRRVLIAHQPGQPELPETILIDPQQWQIDQYQTKASPLALELMNLPDFVSKMWQYPNLQEAMTYSHWVLLSEAVRPHLDDLSMSNPNLSGLESTNPSDLPPIIAQNRLALLSAFPKPENLQAQLELTEIVMANLYGEPVNTAVFSEQSLSNSLWREMANQELIGDLMSSGAELTRDIHTLKARFARETASGHTVSDEDRFELARIEQDASEMEHVIDMAELRLERSARLEQNDHDQGLYEDEPDYGSAPGM